MASSKRTTSTNYLDASEAGDIGASFDDSDFPGGPAYDPTLDDADITGLPDPFPGTEDAIPESLEDGLDEPPVDDDLPEGDGVTDTPQTWEYEGIATRDELARRLGELVIDVRDWADMEDSEEASDLADAMNDLYERFGEPTEDTDT